MRQASLMLRFVPSFRSPINFDVDASPDSIKVEPLEGDALEVPGHRRRVKCGDAPVKVLTIQ
jgi:hypothetical protein